jgi:bacterioferritin (cytochrome b1)
MCQFKLEILLRHRIRRCLISESEVKVTELERCLSDHETKIDLHTKSIVASEKFGLQNYCEPSMER